MYLWVKIYRPYNSLSRITLINKTLTATLDHQKIRRTDKLKFSEIVNF